MTAHRASRLLPAARVASRESGKGSYGLVRRMSNKNDQKEKRSCILGEYCKSSRPPMILVGSPRLLCGQSNGMEHGLTGDRLLVDPTVRSSLHPTIIISTPHGGTLPLRVGRRLVQFFFVSHMYRLHGCAYLISDTMALIVFAAGLSSLQLRTLSDTGKRRLS